MRRIEASTPAILKADVVARLSSHTKTRSRCTRRLRVEWKTYASCSRSGSKGPGMDRWAFAQPSLSISTAILAKSPRRHRKRPLARGQSLLAPRGYPESRPTCMSPGCFASATNRGRQLSGRGGTAALMRLVMTRTSGR